MKKRRETGPRKKQVVEVVRLEDLASRKPVVGGRRRLLFGERIEPPEEDGSPPARKDTPVPD